MSAKFIKVGEPAHDAERQAIKFLVDGLDERCTIYGNPWIVERSGGIYELDAVVVAPHALFVVEIKAYRGTIRGTDYDWYVPEPIRSPLRLNRKTAQVLASELRRRSFDAGRPWVDFLVFLSHAAGVELQGPLSRLHVHTKRSVLDAISDPHSVYQRARSGPASPPVDDHCARTLHELLTGVDKTRAPPRRIREYELENVLDTTDDYTEYAARNTLHDTTRTLRVYTLDPLADPAQRERFLQRRRWEAQVLARVGTHPNVLGADLFFEGDEGVRVCVPFEHFVGISLRSWIPQNERANRGGDGVRRLVGLWQKLAGAISYAHAQGVVHRMLRPDVVLVTPDAAEPDLRVAGFDFAKQLRAGTSLHLSTPLDDERLRWAAPEVVHSFSDADVHSDQFGLGAVLGYMVTNGRPLFESTSALLRRNGVATRARDLNAAVPSALDAAIQRMIALRPTDRFPTLVEAIDAVEAALGTSKRASPAPALRLDPENLEPGQRLGPDYEVREKLGTGGLATVYSARHLVSGAARALKVARPAEGAEDALRGEHRALLDLGEHPNVVRAVDLSYVVPERLTLVMERIEGMPLSRWLADHREPAPSILRKYAEDLLSALAFLEKSDVIHKDIKPDNLMVGDRGLTLIDFSLAGHSNDAPFIGTALYKDPSFERWSHVSDRYAAALCLFEIYTGRHPFNGRAPMPGEQPDIADDELDAPALSAFFRKALDPIPERRHPSAIAMRAALLEALGKPASTPPTGAEPVRSAAATAPLTTTALSSTSSAILRRAGVRTQGELVALSESQVRSLRGLGKKKLREVLAVRQSLLDAGVPPELSVVGERRALWPTLNGDSTDIHRLPLPSGLRESLVQAGYRTVGQLADATREELSAIDGVSAGRISQVVQALHDFSEGGSGGGPPPATLTELWARASQPLTPREREVVEGLFGFHSAPLVQTELAESLGVPQSEVSRNKDRALDRLEMRELEEALDNIERHLSADGGVLTLRDAAHALTEKMIEPLPEEEALARGLTRLLVSLQQVRMRWIADLDDGSLELVVRPAFDRDVLKAFLETARQLAAWPPAQPDAARRSLRPLLPEYEHDVVALVARLLLDVELTDGGELFETPVDASDSIAYVLTRRRLPMSVTELQEHVRQSFGEHVVFPIAEELARIVAALGDYRLEGETLLPAAGHAIEAPEAARDPVPDDLRAPDRSPEQVLVARLRDAAERREWRLLVTPPEHHADYGRSVAAAIPNAEYVSFEQRLLERIEPTFADFESALRMKARRRKLTREAEALLEELLRERGRPECRTILGGTALLQICDAAHLVRALYDETQGGQRGFWAVVIPGVIQERQPLLNEKEPVFHLPGATLPLSGPLPRLGEG